MKKISLTHLLLASNGVLIACLAWSGAQSQAASPIQDVVRAHSIELVNDRGEARAQLYLGEDGAGQIRLRNASGEVRVKLGATPDGAVLLMMDDATEPAVKLTSEEASPSLKLTAGQRQRIVEP